MYVFSKRQKCYLQHDSYFLNNLRVSIIIKPWANNCSMMLTMILVLPQTSSCLMRNTRFHRIAEIRATIAISQERKLIASQTRTRKQSDMHSMKVRFTTIGWTFFTIRVVIMKCASYSYKPRMIESTAFQWSVQEKPDHARAYPSCFTKCHRVHNGLDSWVASIIAMSLRLLTLTAQACCFLPWTSAASKSSSSSWAWSV